MFLLTSVQSATGELPSRVGGELRLKGGGGCHEQRRERRAQETHDSIAHWHLLTRREELLQAGVEGAAPVRVAQEDDAFLLRRVPGELRLEIPIVAAVL